MRIFILYKQHRKCSHTTPALYSLIHDMYNEQLPNIYSMQTSLLVFIIIGEPIFRKFFSWTPLKCRTSNNNIRFLPLDSNEFLSKSRRARYDITHYWLCNSESKEENTLIGQSSASGKILRTSNKSQMFNMFQCPIRNNCCCTDMTNGLRVTTSDSFLIFPF